MHQSFKYLTDRCLGGLKLVRSDWSEKCVIAHRRGSTSDSRQPGIPFGPPSSFPAQARLPSMSANTGALAFPVCIVAVLNSRMQCSKSRAVSPRFRRILSPMPSVPFYDPREASSMKAFPWTRHYELFNHNDVPSESKSLSMQPFISAAESLSSLMSRRPDPR